MNPSEARIRPLDLAVVAYEAHWQKYASIASDGKHRGAIKAAINAAHEALIEERDWYVVQASEVAQLQKALRGVRAHLVELEWRNLPDVRLALDRIDRALAGSPVQQEASKVTQLRESLSKIRGWLVAERTPYRVYDEIDAALAGSESPTNPDATENM